MYGPTLRYALQARGARWGTTGSLVIHWIGWLLAARTQIGKPRQGPSAMPPRIQALPPLVVNQIAAGQVIERPATVVNELLENSVHAGSTRIEIDVDQGGHDLVRIVDDGHVIAPDD